MPRSRDHAQEARDHHDGADRALKAFADAVNTYTATQPEAIAVLYSVLYMLLSKQQAAIDELISAARAAATRLTRLSYDVEILKINTSPVVDEDEEVHDEDGAVVTFGVGEEEAGDEEVPVDAKTMEVYREIIELATGLIDAPANVVPRPANVGRRLQEADRLARLVLKQLGLR